jgi:hypothetical protein
MTAYAELLQDFNWKKRRHEILERDHYKCQECQNEEIKKSCRKAYYIKNISRYQTLNEFFSVVNNYKIQLADEENGGVYEGYLSTNKNDLSIDHTENYTIYYCLEKNAPGENDQIFIKYVHERGSSAPVFVRHLHVHHNYYQDEKLPWDYPDNALKTLCWICHEKFHASREVEWLDKNGYRKGF